MGGTGFGPMDKGKFTVLLHCLHEGIADADRDVEIFQVSRILGMNELFDVGMIASQDAHLRAAPRTCGLDRFA